MNRKALLVVAIVFVLGVAVGAMGFYLASNQVVAGGDRRATLVERLTMELSLTPEQQGQLTAILDESKKRYDEIYAPIRPQVDAVRQQGRQKIRAILNAEQLAKFEDRLRRMDEERAKRNSAK